MDDRSNHGTSVLLFDEHAADPLRFLLRCNRHHNNEQEAQQAHNKEATQANAVGASGAASPTPTSPSAGGAGGFQAAASPTSPVPSPASAANSSSSQTTAPLRVRIPATETRIECDTKKPYTVFLIQLLACCSSLSQQRHRTRACMRASTHACNLLLTSFLVGL
jgi:hypothetical protein